LRDILVAVAVALVAPPLLMLLFANFLPHSGAIGLATVIIAGLAGMMGILFAHWHAETKLIVAMLYLAIAYAVMPLIALLAFCTVGDCALES